MVLNVKEFDVIIDDDDALKVCNHKWTASRRITNGYKLIYFYTWIYNDRKEKKIIYLHRFIMNTPKGFYTDHINGDTLDNRKENLRICTNCDNAANRRISKNNTSGYKGVSKTGSNSWKAMITNRGRHIYLGTHKTPELAYEAYCNASKKYHGGFGRIK